MWNKIVIQRKSFNKDGKHVTAIDSNKKGAWALLWVWLAFFNNVICSLHLNQGCQMVFFQTKNPHLGKFWRVWQLKLLVYFMSIWYTLRPFAIFYGNLVYFLVIWYILSCFVMLYLAALKIHWQFSFTYVGPKNFFSCRCAQFDFVSELTSENRLNCLIN
jgi:hypothetical protein